MVGVDRPGTETVTELLAIYLRELDSSVDKLAHGQEWFTSRLPRWVLANRSVRVGLNKGASGCVVKIVADATLQHDHFETILLETDDDLRALCAPWERGFPLAALSRMNDFIGLAELSVTEVGNPLAPPALYDPTFTGWGTFEHARHFFSATQAREDALNFWNSAVSGLPGSDSFVHEASTVFSRFESLLGRRAFVERRLHRFINEYGQLLLPSCRRYLFELPLRLCGEERKADFVLEREEGLPALLVELENPNHRVLKGRGEFTHAVHHAREQIAEWVKFVDENAGQNAGGDLGFLKGPKERLVVIGRDSDRQRLLNSKYQDTSVWTYDVLLDEAKRRWTDIIRSQREMLDLPPIALF